MVYECVWYEQCESVCGEEVVAGVQATLSRSSVEEERSSRVGPGKGCREGQQLRYGRCCYYYMGSGPCSLQEVPSG